MDHDRPGPAGIYHPCGCHPNDSSDSLLPGRAHHRELRILSQDPRQSSTGTSFTLRLPQPAPKRIDRPPVKSLRGPTRDRQPAKSKQDVAGGPREHSPTPRPIGNSNGHARKKEEFHRAFAVSTCDDFFNFFAVLIILPIELVTGLLAKTATFLTASLAEVTATGFRSPIEPVLHFGFAPLNEIAKALSNSQQIQGSFLILLSGSLVFFALIHLVKALRQSAKTRVHTLITRALKQPALISMALGFGATAPVQSSSITTSLLVPLAGAGFISLHQAFPIVLGANLGTTMTALLAALAGTGENASAGLAIALIHCLFNATGIAAIYPWKRIRAIPLWCSEKLADTGIRSAPTAIAYVLILFYGIPALFAILHQMRG